MIQKLNEFVESLGVVEIENDYGEKRECFPNGYRVSLVDKDNGVVSIAPADYNGYYDWEKFGNSFSKDEDDYGCVVTSNEDLARAIILSIYNFLPLEIVKNFTSAELR